MPTFFPVPLLVGFLPGVCVNGPAGDSLANVLCSLSYSRGETTAE